MGLLNWLFGSKKEKFPKGTVEHNAQKMKKKYPLNEVAFLEKKGKTSELFILKIKRQRQNAFIPK